MPSTSPFEGSLRQFLKDHRSWYRLEPRARSDDFGPGLEARTADPLWMLTRQWQLGEFQAQDAGSPCAAYVGYNVHPIQSVRLGDSEQVQPLDDLPLETIVERERPVIDFRFRVQIGQQFERLLRTRLGEAGIEDGDIQDAILFYRNHFELHVPPDGKLVEYDEPTQRFVRFMAGRVCDGEAIVNSGMMDAPSQIEYPESLTTADTLERAEPAVKEAFEQLQAWQTNLLSEPTEKTFLFGVGLEYQGDLEAEDLSEAFRQQFESQGITLSYDLTFERVEPGKWRIKDNDSGRTYIVSRQDEALNIYETCVAWDNTQLLYRFETNLNDAQDLAEEPALVVSDYRNGELDWYSFATKSDTLKVGGESKDFETIPTRLDVADQSPRWWAFANKQLNLSQLHTLTTDLAKILFTEFVSDYSDDWFQVPLEVPIGSVVRIDGFVVTDVFGVEEKLTVARNAGSSPLDRWEMYSLGRAPSPDAAGVSVLLIPPLSGYRQESEPLEEIRFTRDEGANMVWGIEQIVPNGLGRPVQGREAQRARRVRQLEFEIAGLQRDLEDALRDSEDTSLTPGTRQRRAEDAKEHEIQIAKLKAELEQSVDAAGIPRYLLSTTVPDNWIPFLPYNIGDFLDRRTGSIALRRATMWRDIEDPEPQPLDAMTTLLGIDGKNLEWLEEEAVPRAGVRVVLTRQRVRWHDGTTYVWLGRKVLAGRGEENSGLRFDYMQE